MTNEEAVSILESWNWRFAKSMPTQENQIGQM